MGEPVVISYKGRELKFCCASCIAPFKEDAKARLKKVDAKIVADQLRFYPTAKCVVTGEDLDPEDTLNLVVCNRLFRLCCRMCVSKVIGDPAKYIAVLDAAVVKAQRADYPIDTCVIAGGKLGSMGTPTELVIAGRLVRFCCAGCNPKAKLKPLPILQLLDKAWNAKGKYKLSK